MRHPKDGCLALTANDIAWENGFFGIPHFMKSLINGLGKDGLKFIGLIRSQVHFHPLHSSDTTGCQDKKSKKLGRRLDWLPEQ